MDDMTVKERLRAFHEFVYEYADTQSPIKGEKEIRAFIKEFIEKYENVFGINSHNAMHLKSSTWYPTQVLMRYIREMLRLRMPDVSMHKVMKKDEYWFEYYKTDQNRGTITIVNDPRKEHPEIRATINDTIKTIRKRNPTWDVTLKFQKDKPYEFIVAINPNLITKGATVSES